MDNFEKCTVAMLGEPCSQHVTGNTSRQNQPQSAIIKGLRPVLEGFVVPMHEGACETGSQIPRDLTYCSHKPECIGTTNPDRSVLITIITWRFQFHPVNVSNLHVKGAYVLEARAVSRAPPIVTSRGAP